MHRRIPLVALALCCFAAARGHAAAVPPTAKAPVPAQTFPLESYGYRPQANAMALRAGYTNATVHFIDAENLLLTYSARTLMARAQDQREGDDDHTVRAIVIHLPDGKALRQAEWRLHDRGQYIWPLAGGHFLLRIRGDLYTLDPLGTANPEHMGQQLIIDSNNTLTLLDTTTLHDVLLLETTPAPKIGDDPSDSKSPPVTASFYGVKINPDRTVALHQRGRLNAPDPFSFPFTAIGALQSIQEDRSHWGFDFHPFNGATLELAGFTSTCRPRAWFISAAEFIAFGCRGGTDRRLMAGFNLMAQAKWVFTTDDPPLWLAIESAPAVGRFAMRNTLTTNTTDEDSISNGDIRAQEVRVYGDSEGDELLRVNVSPVQKPAGNFALSPNGLRLAVLRDSNLEIYNLPPVNTADQKLHAQELKALEPLEKASEANIAVSLSNPDATTPPRH